MEQSIASQIITFETLLEFNKFIDGAISVHKSELARYEDELGMMLRQGGQDSGKAEWTKELEGKLAKGNDDKSDGKKDEGKKDEGKKDDKKEKKQKKKDEMKEKKEKKKNEKGKKGPSNWKIYKDVQIFTGIASQGKAAVYFDAINDLKIALDKLNKVKEALSQLTSIGMNNVLYFAYVRSGMVDKLVLLPQEKQEEGRFEFKADFVTENVEVPVES